MKMIANEEDIRSSLEILFSTSVGERIMQPTYGCDLKKLLFEPLDASLKAYVQDMIKTAILYFEPRIRLDNVTLIEKPDEGRVDIVLDYTIQTSNSRYNYVYRFYLEEGTVGAYEPNV